MKYLTLILCFLFPFFAIAEEITVEVGNTNAVLDIIQGSAETTLEMIYNNIETEVNIIQGDTIKIIQGTREVIVEVVDGDQNDLIQAIQEKPDIHYFSKTEEEGMAIFEIWGKPDIGKLEREGYQKTTIENIHMEGYLTPSESEAEAEINGIIDKGNGDAYYGRSSWINSKTQNSTKKIDSGSKTTRPWYLPGNLFLACTLYKYEPGPQWVRQGTHAHYTWGWSTSFTFQRSYPEYDSYRWKQRGMHSWGGSDNATTEALKEY